MAAKRAAALCALLVIISTIFFPLNAGAQKADTARQVQGGICVYKAGSDIQGWIDGELTEKAGLTSEWYIMTLAQSGGYDFSGYERALLRYLGTNKVASATSREKYALALISIGSDDEYILKTLSDSVGGQGLMSLIFGLHILNNGYTVSGVTAEGVISDILSLQKSDGGFAIIGDKGDPDCTAMTVTALAPHYNKSSGVKKACDRALDFLSGIQQPDGSFRSFGVDNCESTAQVMLALCSLGIDPTGDSRFIKGGSDLTDALLSFKTAEGGFSHARGEGANESATVQAFYCFAAYERMSEGKSAFFIFDNARPSAAKKPAEQSPAVTTKAAGGASPQTGKTKTTTKTVIQKPQPQTQSPAPQTSASAGGGAAKSDTTAKATKKAESSAKAGTTKKTAAVSGSAAAPADTQSGSVQTTPAQQSETVQSTPSSSQSGVTETEGSAQKSEQRAAEKGGNNIKLYIFIGIGAAAAAAMLLLAVRGRRNIKSYIFVLIVGGALCAVTAVLDIETKEDHYAPESSITESESAGQVSVSIDCLTLLGEADNIPENGYLLGPETIDIYDGETAFELLDRLARERGIILDIKGSDDYIYVAGIAGLYEYDYGELSGWMYYVNGSAPSVNSSQYVLKDGDRVEWRYTREIGHDLEDMS